mmetsp:Transcript_89173/g.265975  ORF Transcript_89173/g.265975 Transcript_89173/m.265975 type:complete len:207 (-) Transcript_89173:11-631(-)
MGVDGIAARVGVGEPKVDEEWRVAVKGTAVLAANHDVGIVDVAVHETALVDCTQASKQQVPQGANAHPPLLRRTQLELLQDLCQWRAQQLHGEPGLAPMHARVKHLGDPQARRGRSAQCADGPRLAVAGGVLRGREDVAPGGRRPARARCRRVGAEASGARRAPLAQEDAAPGAPADPPADCVIPEPEARRARHRAAPTWADLRGT